MAKLEKSNIHTCEIAKKDNLVIAKNHRNEITILRITYGSSVQFVHIPNDKELLLKLSSIFKDLTNEI